MGVIDRVHSFRQQAPAPSPESSAVGQSDGEGSNGPKRSRAPFYGAALLVVAGLAGYAVWQYWTVWRLEESTDDAYVQADIIPIAPQVAGYIDNVFVNDNQAVRAGDVLATIDPRGYQDALNQAKADVAQAEANISQITAQLSEQSALIEEAQATLRTDQASDVYAQQNRERFGALQKSGSGSLQEAQQTLAQADSSEAIVARDQAALEAATKQVDTLQAGLAEAKATLAHNRAALAQAQLNLGYTTLRAPTNGVIGSRMARVGLFAQPGQQLMAVVPVTAAYVVANFKETQLARIRSGQPVEIDVDAFADRPIRGYVNSIAPASGQEFSLLPPDNATGNFTKIVQRVPVKISIDRGDPLAGRLLPGMSVTATIKVVSDDRPGQSVGKDGVSRP
ncbi:HlyD family secretion protein [Rhizobium cauense]|uniref:HlyD family secretion protein n=1 Tax=Rhizobium cauense TaxID=1166683 RepID=UPI001C6E76C8|nr:HlyD family secretion protein [Rhizobium cauense]MBW9116447.1 HlyD family secretion protein [Rhizobium cauense]